MGSLYQLGGLVFTTETGTFINRSSPRNRFVVSLLRHTELPDICLHNLGYTCTNLLL